MSAADNRTDAAALLPAEREMAPDEIAEYHGAPQRLRARFHALAAAHAEAAAAVERLSFDCDHWMGVAVARAEAAAAAKTALADALARGEDEGYRRAVADVLRLLVHPSDKAAVRGLLGGRDAALGVDAVDRARAEGEAAGAARERERVLALVEAAYDAAREAERRYEIDPSAASDALDALELRIEAGAHVAPADG